jgi:DNA primase large subunit
MKRFHFTLQVKHFLRLAADLKGAEFRLVNQQVDDGWVFMTQQFFALLLRTRLEKMLFEKIKTLPKNMAFNQDRLQEIYEKYRWKEIIVTNSGAQRGKPTGKMPPCVDFIIKKIENEHHAGHSERVLLGLYLQKKNYPEDYILNLYSKLEDYKEKITQQQLKSLDKYEHVHSCDKINTQKMCYHDGKRCNQISNPEYY